MDTSFPFPSPAAQPGLSQAAVAFGPARVVAAVRYAAGLGPQNADAPRHQARIDLLSQRLAIHLSQEVWQRLIHGTGRPGICFTEAPLALLFVESPGAAGHSLGQDDFLGAFEPLARLHGGTVDEFAWGGSLAFFPQVLDAVRTGAAMQRAVPEWRLRMGVSHGDCLLAHFRSGGGSHATLLGAEAADAVTMAGAVEGGLIGMSAAAQAQWLATPPGDRAAGDDCSALVWPATGMHPQAPIVNGLPRTERPGNGGMRHVPTNGARSGA